MGRVRGAIVWVLLALETLVTLPFFALSWVVSAIGLAILGGFHFARLDTDQEKRAVLLKLMGEDKK